MKKFILIFLSVFIIFNIVSCANKEREDASEPNIENQSVQNPIIITGIVIRTQSGSVTLSEIEGYDGEETIELVISNETVFDVAKDYLEEGKFVKAEVPSTMTDDSPPQCNAIKVMEINEIVLGEILETNESSFTLRPISGVYGNQEMKVMINEDTEWRVVKESVVSGQIIRVMIESQMTASVPPQVNAISILSIEVRD